MGGGYALALAPDRGFSASSVNYGGCPKDAETFLASACPIVGSYGGKDHTPLGRRAAVRLEQALTGLGVDHDVKIYPDAGHGFMNDHDPADQTLLLVALAKMFWDQVSRTLDPRRATPHHLFLQQSPEAVRGSRGIRSLAAGGCR